jgi:hypothetical protein
MPPEYWQAVLDDAVADTRPTGSPIQKQRLGEIQRHVLRVECRRCGRTIEIQKVDAVRLAGAHAVWKNVGERLLDNTCQQRTGRQEESPDAVLARPLSLASYPVATGRPLPGHQRPRARRG